MSNEFDDLRQLVARLVSDDATVRDRAADDVADLAPHVDAWRLAFLSQLLVAIRMSEADETCQEAQLHALMRIADNLSGSTDAFEPLRSLKRSELSGSQLEYWQELVGRGPPYRD